MSENKITINAQEFPINFRLMQAIAAKLPEEAQYAPLARAILSLKVPSITELLIGKGILGQEDLDNIWDEGDPELRKALLEEEVFVSQLNEKQAKEVLESDNLELIKQLAYNSEILEFDEENTGRLTKEQTNSIIDKLANHPHAEVQRAFYANPELFEEHLKPLRETLENDYELTTGHLAKLALQDLDILAKSKRNDLKFAATFIENVRNKKVREKLGEILANHPDPEIRLELAENRGTPKKILQKLTEDEDADIALAAKGSLGQTGAM